MSARSQFVEHLNEKDHTGPVQRVKRVSFVGVNWDIPEVTNVVELMCGHAFTIRTGGRQAFHSKYHCPACPKS